MQKPSGGRLTARGGEGMTDPIAAARALIEPLREHREQQTVAGGSWWGAPEICTQAADAIATLADALEAERARAEKAEAERDTAWNDAIEAAKGCVDDNHPFSIMDEMDLLKKGDSHNQQAERGQALARLAAAYEAAAEVYWDGFPAWDTFSAAREAIRTLTPADAQAALDKLLAEARLEGWRAGRDAATEPLTSLAAVLRESEISYHQSQASALLERADFIRALPEPKETSHG